MAAMENNIRTSVWKYTKPSSKKVLSASYDLRVRLIVSPTVVAAVPVEGQAHDPSVRLIQQTPADS